MLGYIFKKMNCIFAKTLTPFQKRVCVATGSVLAISGIIATPIVYTRLKKIDDEHYGYRESIKRDIKQKVSNVIKITDVPDDSRDTVDQVAPYVSLTFNGIMLTTFGLLSISSGMLVFDFWKKLIRPNPSSTCCQLIRHGGGKMFGCLFCTGLLGVGIGGVAYTIMEAGNDIKVIIDRWKKTNEN